MIGSLNNAGLKGGRSGVGSCTNGKEEDNVEIMVIPPHLVPQKKIDSSGWRAEEKTNTQYTKQHKTNIKDRTNVAQGPQKLKTNTSAPYSQKVRTKVPSRFSPKHSQGGNQFKPNKQFVDGLDLDFENFIGGKGSKIEPTEDHKRNQHQNNVEIAQKIREKKHLLQVIVPERRQKAKQKSILKTKGDKKDRQNVNQTVGQPKTKVERINSAQLNLDESPIAILKTEQPQNNFLKEVLNKIGQKLPGSKGKDKQKSKITLKDYIYQTQVTSKKALMRRKDIKNELYQTSKMQNGNQPNQSDLYSDVTSCYKDQKYQASNDRMYQILRQDIRNQIMTVTNHLQNLQKSVNKDIFETSSPTQNQLATFFHIRRVLKDQIRTKTEDLCNNLKNTPSSPFFQPFKLSVGSQDLQFRSV